MTDAERIVHLEAELARALAEKAALLITVQQQALALAQSASTMRSAQALEEKDAERRTAAREKKRLQRAEKRRLEGLSHAGPGTEPDVSQGQDGDKAGTEPPPSPPLDGSPLPSAPTLSSPLSSPHPVSSPSAVAVGDRQPDLLVVPSSQPAKSQRAKRQGAKPAEPRGDPRHQPLIAAMEAVYGELVRRPDADGGGPEKWDWAGKMAGREAGAITALLAKADADPRTAGDAAPAEVLRRWRYALADTFRRVRYAHVLVQHWGTYGAPRAAPAASAPGPLAARAQEIWDALQGWRKGDCEKLELEYAPEEVSSAYLERALAAWAVFPKGDARLRPLADAWVEYASTDRFRVKGLPVRLFLSAGVLEDCLRRAKEDEEADGENAKRATAGQG